MSIASEITRLQTAKNDLATAITNKGVTVPASTTIDGYATLVEQIQGNGGPQPYKTITLEEDHLRPSIANPVYWGDFLNIPCVTDTSDTNCYVVTFENTYTGARSINLLIYFRSNEKINAVLMRDYSFVRLDYSTYRDCFAGVGTIIRCYKCK